MTAPDLRPPFPWFGGKWRAAPLVWAALGDPGGYVEPFAGTIACLLRRPAFTGRRVETVNDADGWLVNAWRSIQLSPGKVAEAAHGPLTEIDYHARLAWLQERRTPDLVAWLEGDPEHHDARAAGWWLYVVAAAIGHAFDSGPWHVVDGHLRKVGGPGRGVCRELPHLGGAGQGVNREMPHLGNAGRGVRRKMPRLGDGGAGYRRDDGDDGVTGWGANREGLRTSGASSGVKGIGGVAAYMDALSARIADVRITCGDWARVVTPSAVRATRGGDGSLGILLDPPYETGVDGTYAEGDKSVAVAVRKWCVEEAPPKARIALCGRDDDHDALLAHGWRKVQGKAGGARGMSSDPLNGRRERLWLSPSCLDATPRLPGLEDVDAC